MDGSGGHRRGRACLGALALVLGASGTFAVSGPPLVAPASAASPAAVAPFNDGTPYPGPLPLAIPATGGVIQAENFNGGAAEQAFHGCTRGDQGTAVEYRSDPHPIDIFRATPGHWFIRASAATSSADPVHNCPPGSFFSDFVKYSFTVGASGWYRLTAAAQNGALFTRIDDVNKGQTPHFGAWSNVVLSEGAYLTAGNTHVLAIELLGFKVDLDSISVTPISVSYPAPRVVDGPLTDEVVVADAVVTDPMFGAVPNNAFFDNRAAIQKALDVVGALGGGTVYVPPGVYTLNGSIGVPANVTLRGEWSVATSTPGQTILAARVPSGLVGPPFISLAASAAVTNLSVWYPNQSFTSPLRYQPTIRSLHQSVSVSNVTLFNSDQGIFFRVGSAADISGLRATCFTTCILDDGNREYAFISNIKISNQYWATAPTEVTRKPVTAANQAALRAWTKRHLTAIHLYRNDNLTVYGVNVADAKRDIVTTAIGCRPSCGTYGSFSKIAAGFDRRGDSRQARPARGVNSIMHTDLVSQAKNLSYKFAPLRLPARTDAAAFYNVMAPPFSAHGDALTDDTAAIQGALNAAAAAGGGTVYLPAATYLVSTRLVVPSGVELRGTYGARHTSEVIDATTLLAVEGHGTTTSNSDPAFISLGAQSGIRGISVRYPRQGFGSVDYPVRSYPYTVRSLGAGTWVREVNVLNGFQIIDLTTHRSDGFVVSNLWATAFATGVNMGGGSKTGWLEKSVISWGDLYQSRHGNSPHFYGRHLIAKYTASRVAAYYLGDVTGLQSLGAMSFSVAHHLTTYRASFSPGPANATLFASSSDSAGAAAFVFGAGSKLSFVGLLARSPVSNTHVSTTTTFSGVAVINDAAISGRHAIVRKGGTLHVFPENLARSALAPK